MEDAINENILLNLQLSYVEGSNYTSTLASSETLIKNIMYVDLDKYKILLPDWSGNIYYTGRISKLSIARNKDRLYDIEYDDGSHIPNIREEYIRLILKDTTSTSTTTYTTTDRNNNDIKSLKLQPGLRVHFKMPTSSTTSTNRNKNRSIYPIYYPGRILELSNSTSTYIIEYDGNSIVKNIPLTDIRIGLSRGDNVEAKKPYIPKLTATAMSINSTGNSVSVAYGANNFDTWATLPGAVCAWNLSRTTSNGSGSGGGGGGGSGSTGGSGERKVEPEYVLDYNNCIVSVCYHPVLPSLMAAGTQSGEVVVWDLNTHQAPLALSPITTYSHSAPITGILWLKNTKRSGGGSGGGGEEMEDEWVIATCGLDGKVLIWALSNGLKYPIAGTVLSMDHSGTGASDDDRNSRSVIEEAVNLVLIITTPSLIESDLTCT